MIPILLQVDEVRNFHPHFTDEGTERELEWFSQSHTDIWWQKKNLKPSPHPHPDYTAHRQAGQDEGAQAVGTCLMLWGRYELELSEEPPICNAI